MTNWKNYVGSTLLAGLLLQGCGSSEEAAVAQTTSVDTAAAASKAIAANTVSTLIDADDLTAATNTAKLDFSSGVAEDATDASDKVKAVVAALVENGRMSQADADYVLANTDLNELYLEAYFDKAAADLQLAPANLAPNRALSLDSILDPIKDGLVDLMDTSVGGAITSATFDVVLNSEGVTVVMLDMARGSETMTQIMIDALGRDWSLTEKMCPMLQTNKEFGEKFAALAEESEPMARFFFERVDAPMYGCLTDAMLLSNDDTAFGSYDDPVYHSTNGYMGILLERYATTFFIEPGTGELGSSGYGTTDTFAGLMFTTGDVVSLDGNVTSGHGDANELINEQFFYSLFKTPETTDAFVTAMQNVESADSANVTLFMDEIFLGSNTTTDFATDDTVQGYYNIISIAGGMYEGIETHGFGTYTGAFIGFAGLIPADRYMSYGSQFMSAGYFWAEQNGVSIWGTVADGAKDLYASYTTPTDTTAATAPARTAGRGTIGTGSAWISDTLDVVVSAWDASDLLGYFGSDLGIIEYYNLEALKAYSTVIGSPDSTNVTTITTVIDGVTYTDDVKGFHGLLELAIREDIVNTNIAEGNTSYNMDDATAAFALPAFGDITWSFLYTSAKDGAVAYYNSFVDAGWLADLSDNTLIRAYFYPSADNVYIPSWLLAIDWLKFPDNFSNADITATDFSFDGGYMDIYVLSPNEALLRTNVEDTIDPDTQEIINDVDVVNPGNINLAAIAGLVKPIEISKLNMGSDSIIVVEEGSVTENGLYVYKVRTVTPEDTAAVMAYLSGLGDSALNAIGINSDNATQTVATAE